MRFLPSSSSGSKSSRNEEAIQMRLHVSWRGGGFALAYQQTGAPSPAESPDPSSQLRAATVKLIEQFRLGTTNWACG
ncbi:hypothetical protein MRB53_040309 [Persea americana]|nr:hypothetical protein MRB53_040309 [Persea americana]